MPAKIQVGRDACRSWTQPFTLDGCTTRRGPHGLAKLSGVELVFSITQVAISAVLVVLILMHSGKDSGLSGAFGVGTGTGPLGGGSLVEQNLNRWTALFAVLFVVNTIVLIKIS